MLGRLLGRPKAPWLVVELRPQLVEFPKPVSALLSMLPGLQERAPTSLDALRRLAKKVGDDPKIRGVAFVVPNMQTGWAGAKAVRDVFTTLRDAGKEVVVYLPEGGATAELYIGTAADRLYLSPQASLICLGVGAETRYYRGLLDKLGVELEPFAHGEFKTAMETLVRDSMSDAQREQVDALLSTLDAELRISMRSRGLDEAQVDAVFEHGFVRGPAAVEFGLADGLGYRDELPTILGVDKKQLMGAGRYLAFHGAEFMRGIRREPFIAVVEVHGAIGAPQSAKKVIASLRAARADSRVRGVVLHVDSPGGSALTSDLIHREVVRLKEKKPVVAYMGNVAASGGYYVSAPTDAIVAQPVTITGSIGVVSAALHAGGLLEKLGVKTEVVRKAPHADMFSLARTVDESERAILEREMKEFYESFVELVAEGRGRPTAAIEAVAQGRVWSGTDALGRGLVDRLGGIDVAGDEVRTRVGDESLALQRFESKRLDVAVPEPPSAPQAIAQLISPELAQVWPLLASRERVLLLALDVPRLR